MSKKPSKSKTPEVPAPAGTKLDDPPAHEDGKKAKGMKMPEWAAKALQTMTKGSTAPCMPPDAATPPKRPLVRQPKARMEWLDKNGKVTKKVMCFRSLPSMAQVLTADLPKDTPDDSPLLAQRIRVTILSDYADAKKSEAVVENVAIDGPLGGVLAALYHRILSPQELSMALSSQFEHLSELTALKGLIVTMVVEDARVGGWGFVSNLTEVTDQDLIMLAEAAASQANLFKESLKKQRPHLKFPSDQAKSTIIIP